MKSVKHSAVALGLGAVSVGLIATGAGSASAASATAYHLTLCAKGNYSAYAELPQQGGSTTLAAPGKCVTVGVDSSTTYAKVRGQWNTSSGTFYIDTVPVKASRGVLVYTYGVTTDPYLWYSN